MTEPFADGSVSLACHITDGSVSAHRDAGVLRAESPQPGFDPSSLHDDDSAYRGLVLTEES